MCVEFDGYRAHIAVEMQEDMPAHVEARSAEVRDFFRGQFNEGARRVEQHAREHREMSAAALREEAHRKLISVEDLNDLLDSVRISSCVNEVTFVVVVAAGNCCRKYRRRM